MENTISENSHLNVKKTDKENSNYEQFEKIEVKDTPFTIIKDNEKYQAFGVMGKYRITEIRESAEEVELELKEMTWNRLVQVIMILTNNTDK